MLEVSVSQALALMGDFDLPVPSWNGNVVGCKQSSRFLKVTEVQGGPTLCDMQLVLLFTGEE